jgi:hypothetical protein
MTIEAEGPEPIHKFMASVQSLGNVKMKFVRTFSIEEMRKMLYTMSRNVCSILRRGLIESGSWQKVWRLNG